MATRILYVITKANWGGAQRYVYYLATAARDAGYEVIVAAGEEGVLTEKLGAEGIQVILVDLRQHRTFLGDLLTFGSLFSLIAIFRQMHPDVVHVNSAKAGGLGTLAARIALVPRILFTAHGWEFNAPRNILSKIGIGFFSWLTILLAHQTIAVSQAVRRDVRLWPGAYRRMLVIPNGIDCPRFLTREEARARLAPSAIGHYWVGMTSEFNPTKRVEDAIYAFSLLVPKHPEAILVLLGEGRERGKLEDLIRDLHLSHHVSLIGFRSNAPELLKAFDLFLQTSLSEALSLALLEAGCAALPVVATRVGGIPEIIPDETHGLLVPPRSPEAIAAAIETLMNNPERAAELGTRLHARVLTEFSKEKMIEQTFALYDH